MLERMGKRRRVLALSGKYIGFWRPRSLSHLLGSFGELGKDFRSPTWRMGSGKIGQILIHESGPITGSIPSKYPKSPRSKSGAFAFNRVIQQNAGLVCRVRLRAKCILGKSEPNANGNGPNSWKRQRPTCGMPNANLWPISQAFQPEWLATASVPAGPTAPSGFELVNSVCFQTIKKDNLFDTQSFFAVTELRFRLGAAHKTHQKPDDHSLPWFQCDEIQRSLECLLTDRFHPHHHSGTEG